MSNKVYPRTTLTKSVKRGFKQHAGKYWRHYIRSPYYVPKRRGTLGPRAKAIGFTPSGKRELGLKLPLGHYEDYLRRPVHPMGLTPPSRKPRAGVTPMGELGPELLFHIYMHPMVKQALLNNAKGVYRDIVGEMRRFVKNISLFIQQGLVGDPRVFASKKDGLVPRGGTGYMRLMTRSYLEAQINRYKDFPFSLMFKIPVKYAKPLNAMTSYQLAHSGKYGWRIVDYTPSGKGLKARYKRIKLNDPLAVGGFFEKIVELSRIKAAIQFMKLLRRIGKYNHTALVGIKDMFGNQVELNADAFIFSPSEFASLV